MHPVVGLMYAMFNAEENAAAKEAAAKVQKPEPPRLSLTERAIYHMLVENTGCDILDSGGAYGRSWQRNQGRAFWDEEPTTLSFNVRIYTRHGEEETHWDMDLTHNVYHWLKERLDYDRPMNKRFMKFANQEENKDCYWLELMEKFMDYLKETGHEVSGGPYGDGEPDCTNTYNGEDLLSQTLQYMHFYCDETEYVLLQIHGGADVRGGYTAPKAFRVSGDECCLYDNARASIAPDWEELQEKIREDEEYREQNPVLPETDPKWNSSPLREYEHLHWYTDDGCHWYYEGCCGSGYNDKQLEKFPGKAIEKREDWEKGYLCVLPDGTGLCPLTGCTLRAGAY